MLVKTKKKIVQIKNKTKQNYEKRNNDLEMLPGNLIAVN